jgi:hypothetical protein
MAAEVRMPFLVTLLQLVMLLAWIALLVLNIWVWQKTKTHGPLLMIVGASLTALTHFITLVAMPTTFLFALLPIVGIGVFVYGYYLSVRPMVQARVDALAAKIRTVTSDGSSGPSDGSADAPDPSAAAKGTREDGPSAGGAE